MSDPSHWINGEWVKGTGEQVFCTNPVTGQTNWQGHEADADQVDLAVRAARSALRNWSARSLDDRIERVLAYREKLEADREGMAEAISQDTGKPLWESLAEVTVMIGKVGLSIDAYRERKPDTNSDMNGLRGVTAYRPIGVCGVLGPFNLPGHLPNGHIVPSLIAGNTVVFKPSEFASSVADRMTRLWHQTGLPDGVFNTVQGGRMTGAALAEHEGLDGLFFTGSSATGRVLSRIFAERPGSMLALELGGNNPLVVWGEQDLQAAAYATVLSAYITAGQRCTCARRLIIPTSPMGEALIERLAGMIAELRVGPYTSDPEPFMGPVINAAAAVRMLEVQERFRKNGARLIMEMVPIGGCPAMLSPGLIDVTEANERSDDEWFGPMLQVVRVDDFEHAIDEANRTAYGLSASLLDNDRDRFEQFFQRVRAGVINWNQATTGASGRLPFGGVGASGNHRPSGYFACDYCAYPVASMRRDVLTVPDSLAPGITV